MNIISIMVFMKCVNTNARYNASAYGRHRTTLKNDNKSVDHAVENVIATVAKQQNLKNQ